MKHSNINTKASVRPTRSSFAHDLNLCLCYIYFWSLMKVKSPSPELAVAVELTIFGANEYWKGRVLVIGCPLVMLDKHARNGSS